MCTYKQTKHNFDMQKRKIQNPLVLKLWTLAYQSEASCINKNKIFSFSWLQGNCERQSSRHMPKELLSYSL